jgi:hypothetical protein
MSVTFLNVNERAGEPVEWTGCIHARYYSPAMGATPSEYRVLVNMETIVNFIEELDVNITRLSFNYMSCESGVLKEMPSLERFHHLELLSFSDFCDLTEVPRLYAGCVGIRYALKFTKFSSKLYEETFPTGDWNVLSISNWCIKRLHWPRHLSQLILINCLIRDVSPPEGGTFAGGEITTDECDFSNPFYEEMWNTRRARRVARYGVSLSTLDHMVSLDNFALMRQCTLRNFNRLAGEGRVAVNVTDRGVPKINSAAALASNVLRRAAEFVYF